MKHGVTHLGTAPTAYKAMLSQPELDEALKTLRTCISAGEHLPEATWRAWKERTGIAIIDGIGSTEMMHIFVSAAGDDIRPGSTGNAVPGYDSDRSRRRRQSARRRRRPPRDQGPDRLPLPR